MSRILRKYESVTNLRVYEVQLTDEEAKLFEEDEDKFWDTVDCDWEFQHDKAGDPDDEYELVDE